MNNPLPEFFFVHKLNKSYYKMIFLFSDYSHDKLSRDLAVNNIRSDVVSSIRETFGADDSDGAKTTEYFNLVCKEVFREIIFEQDIRCDGRQLNHLRNISCQVCIFK